jgi:hypothetical protein
VRCRLLDFIEKSQIRFVKIVERRGGVSIPLRRTESASTASRAVTRVERRPLIRLAKIGFASPKSPDRVGGIAPGRAASEAHSPRPVGGGRQLVVAQVIIDVSLCGGSDGRARSGGEGPKRASRRL